MSSSNLNRKKVANSVRSAFGIDKNLQEGNSITDKVSDMLDKFSVSGPSLGASITEGLKKKRKQDGSQTE